MKNPILELLTERQKKVAAAEMKEEGYYVLQKWTNKKGERDYRVLRDTIIVTPTSIIDRISWIFKKTI